jgi:hypothetical protein
LIKEVGSNYILFAILLDPTRFNFKAPKKGGEGRISTKGGGGELYTYAFPI